MANRYRSNFLYGTVSGYSATAVTFTGTGFNAITLPSGYYLPVILNPGYPGSNTNSEVIYIGGITGNTATVLNSSVTSGRGQENTVAASGAAGTVWITGPLVSDFSLTNNIINGDFPTPASGGQYFVSSSTTSGQWTSSLNAAILSGTAPTSFSVNANNIGIISGTQVSGYSPNIGVAGANVSGFVANATNATNATNASNFTGSSIYNVTISGSSVIAAGVTLASGVIFAGGIAVPTTGTITLNQITNSGTWNASIPFPANQISGTGTSFNVTGNITASGNASQFAGMSITGASGLQVNNNLNVGSGITTYTLNVGNNSVLNNIYSNNAFSYINGLATNTLASNVFTASGSTTTSGLTVNNNATIGNNLIIGGNLTASGSISLPSHSISANTLTAGSNGQVLTTSGSSVVWSTGSAIGPWSSYLTSGSYINLTQAANNQVANVAVSGYNNYLITANWFVNHGSVNTILRYGVGTVDGFGYLTYTGPKVALNIAGALGADNVRPYSYSALFSPGSTASTKAGLGMYVDNNAGGASAGFVMFTVVGIN